MVQKSGQPLEVVSLSHDLQVLIHPRLFGISEPSAVSCLFLVAHWQVFLNKSQQPFLQLNLKGLSFSTFKKTCPKVS